MSPSGPMATSVHPLNGPAGRATVSTLWMRTGRSVRYPVCEGVPGTPRVSSSSPSGLNFRTEWSPLSTQYTAPSGPIADVVRVGEGSGSPRPDELPG